MPGVDHEEEREDVPFLRCSTRDKFGTDRCSGRPLPAGAIDDFVVERLTEATADGTLATRIEAKLSARVAKERATFVEVRKALAAQIAEASATTAKLTDEVVRLEGRARELVEAKLRAEATRLDDAERRLRALEDDALDLELVESQREWLAAYSDVIRSAFRRHSIAVPRVSDQGSEGFDQRFRSFDQPFRSSDHSRPSG